jgi:hypothetical protein
VAEGCGRAGSVWVVARGGGGAVVVSGGELTPMVVAAPPRVEVRVQGDFSSVVIEDVRGGWREVKQRCREGAAATVGGWQAMVGTGGGGAVRGRRARSGSVW